MIGITDKNALAELRDSARAILKLASLFGRQEGTGEQAIRNHITGKYS